MRLIAKKPKELLIQLGVIALLLIGAVFVFFYIYLPSATNHGETLTVPDLEGVPFEEVDEFLTKRNLRYEVTRDSAFSPTFPPLTILQQDPKPFSKVKENRKIYITLNMRTPPTTKMPCLIDGSIKNAQSVLRSHGLQLGSIRYRPALGVNSVLAQRYDGKEYTNCKEINQGIDIPKGAKIDLIAADGYGRRVFSVPSLVGLSLDEAEFILIGSGLKFGSQIFQVNPASLDSLNRAKLMKALGNVDDFSSLEITPGTIIKQRPTSEEKTKIGRSIDVWIAGSRQEYEKKLKEDSLAQLDQAFLELE